MKKENVRKADVTHMHIDIPEEIYNMQLPNPEVVTYYNEERDRILWIDEEITTYSIEIAKKILKWNRDDATLPSDERQPIKLMIFSYGGDLEACDTLLDTIELSTTPIIGINVGQALSAGCLIFLACHKRLMFPRSRFLMHHGYGEFQGTKAQVMNAVESYKQEMESMEEYVMSRTNIPEDIFKENFNSDDWYIYADQAIEWGIADGIVENLDEIYE